MSLLEETLKVIASQKNDARMGKHWSAEEEAFRNLRSYEPNLLKSQNNKRKAK